MTEDALLKSPELEDLVPPEESAVISLTGPPVAPEQRIYFYSPDEWERFVREWATGLETSYAQIKLLGGPGDQGVDVAAFATDRGFEAEWDCFQGKHYSDPLRPSDAFPEILKVLRHVSAGHYSLPGRYAFLAPRGCGAKLNRLLSKPTELRTEFLACSALEAAPMPEREELTELANAIDFSMFCSVELEDVLDTHRKTHYFAARFGGPLAPRPPVGDPPATLEPHETRYVAQLIEVYEEADAGAAVDAENLSNHPDVGEHFRRQRSAFYQAEALRVYARDSVPAGTFERLQGDVFAGVVEVADGAHPNGMSRLSSVLTTSGQLDLSSHTLVSVSTLEDRKGICHQLANEDRLIWVRAAP